MTFPKPEILLSSCEYDGYFKIFKVDLLQPRLDGTSPRKVTRYVFERGDAAAVLLHDPRNHSVVLTRQFRLPAYLRDASGWQLEIVAGTVSEGENFLEIARKELLEEAGLTIRDIRFVFSFFLSPGGSTERCFLFECPVDSTELHGRLTGEKGTNEEIRLEVHPLKDALRMIYEGEITDAKTIIALQFLANKTYERSKNSIFT